MTQQYATGNKYHRAMTETINGSGTVIIVDVYDVLRTFEVIDPGLQHAVKKLLCAGIRNKASLETDLREAIDAITRSLDFASTPNPTMHKES